MVSLYAKGEYFKARKEFEALVGKCLKHFSLLILVSQRWGIKQSIFRIYRDARFAKKGDPVYKIHFFAWLCFALQTWMQEFVCRGLHLYRIWKFFSEGIIGKKLKIVPRGFDKDFAYIELLRPTHYVVIHRVFDLFQELEALLSDLEEIFFCCLSICSIY